MYTVYIMYILYSKYILYKKYLEQGTRGLNKYLTHVVVYVWVDTPHRSNIYIYFAQVTRQEQR